MKLNLQNMNLIIPEGYDVTSILCTGPMDSGKQQAAAPMMPTMAKAQAFEHRRVLAFSKKKTGGGTVPIEILRAALADMQKRTRGKVQNVEEGELNGAPTIRAELHHSMEKMPTVTFACLAGIGDELVSIVLTALEDPKAVVAARADFDKAITDLVPA